MIKPNNQNSNLGCLPTQKSHSNTHLFLHPPLTLSTNSFNSLLPTNSDSHFLPKLLSTHLDYLRVSSTDLTKKQLNILVNYLFSGVDYKTINKPWHPEPKMPKSKKYQNIIVHKKGIILGYTKRAKYHGRNTRYVYDIMIDFTGAYFANLSLLEQINLIQHLNSNFKLKCHRIDIAIDDYLRKLFPVGQMISAYLFDNNFGFQVIDDSYIDIVNNKLTGTLGIGSRYSNFFIRIYTKRKAFVRWETELKRGKAQKLFAQLANLIKKNHEEVSSISDINKALVDAALGSIDFRDKSRCMSPKNATVVRTKRLVFWEVFLNVIYSLTEKVADSNELNDSPSKH